MQRSQIEQWCWQQSKFRLHLVETAGISSDVWRSTQRWTAKPPALWNQRSQTPQWRAPGCWATGKDRTAEHLWRWIPRAVNDRLQTLQVTLLLLHSTRSSGVFAIASRHAGRSWAKVSQFTMPPKRRSRATRSFHRSRGPQAGRGSEKKLNSISFGSRLSGILATCPSHCRRRCLTVSDGSAISPQRLRSSWLLTCCSCWSSRDTPRMNLRERWWKLLMATMSLFSGVQHSQA